MGSSMTELQTSQQHRANSVARIDSAILARQNDLPPSERATGLELSSGQSRIPIFTPLTATQARVGPTHRRIEHAIARVGRCDRRALRQIEGSRLGSVARLSSGAKCRPAKLARNWDGASAGNCTGISSDASCLFQSACENRCPALSERYREDAALGDLVASWYRLTPFVRYAVLARVRSCETG